MANLRLTAERGSAFPKAARVFAKTAAVRLLGTAVQVQVLSGGQHEGIASDKNRILQEKLLQVAEKDI